MAPPAPRKRLRTDGLDRADIESEMETTLPAHCATAHRPRFATFSAYSSTEFSAKFHRFCTTAVSSRMRRPFSPSTFCVRVARMITSVRIGVTRTSTPE